MSLIARAPRAVLFAAAAAVTLACPVASFASELFVSRWDAVSSFDTSTGQRLTDTAIAGEPSGVAFRSRSDMYVANAYSNTWRVDRFGLGGGAWGLTSSRDLRSWSLNGVNVQKPGALTRGPDGRFYLAAGNSHNIVALGNDQVVTDANGATQNFGPSGTQYIGPGGGTMGPLSFPKDVAFDRYTLEAAVANARGTVQIFQGTSVARTLNIADTLTGLTYDFSGRPIMDGQGKFTGEVHSYLYVAGYGGIRRYDAATLAPMGSDAADPTNPMFIANGVGGLQGAEDVAISPEDGMLYVADGYTNSVLRYSPDTGAPRGRANDGQSATVIDHVGTQIMRLAFRPLDERYNFENDGKFVVGPNGTFVPRPESDITVTSAAGRHGEASLVDDHTGHGNFTAGGANSGKTTASVGAGQTYTIGGVAQADQNGTITVDGTMTGNGFVATNGGTLIGQAGGNLIGQAGGNLIGQAGGNLSPRDLAALIGQAGGNLIGQAGGNLIGQAGGNFVATNGGTIAGSGTFSGNAMVIGNGGALRPGQSPGLLTLNGSLILANDATLGVELAGTTVGSAYDRVAVTAGANGLVLLDGVLEVKLLDGFAASISSADVFTILTSDVAITGTFDNVVDGRVTTLDGNGSFAVTLGAGGTSLVLSDFAAVPEPATLAALAGVGAMLLRRRRH